MKTLTIITLLFTLIFCVWYVAWSLGYEAGREACRFEFKDLLLDIRRCTCGY